jgi:hypothetical protein
MPAAYLLDPINWSVDRGSVKMPFDKLTGEERTDTIATIVRLNGGPSAPGNSRASKDLYADWTGKVQEEMDKLELEPWPEELQSMALRMAGRRTTLVTAAANELNKIVPVSAARRTGLWTVYFAVLFPLLAKAAVKLLAIHVTSGAAERNWSKWGQVYGNARRNRLEIDKAAKLVSIMAWHGKQSASDSPDTLVSLDYVEESEGEE